MSLTQSRERVQSIDVLRGLIMVIMAIDHVREYFHYTALTQNPLDPATSTPALYFTRWITHLCAPLFVFLSGTSAYLAGRKRTKAQFSGFLIKRGLWLILIDLVLMSLLLTFDPNYGVLILQVIWAIGISMVLLGLLVWLPLPVIFALGLIIFFGHNLLDSAEVARKGDVGVMWSLAHRVGFFSLGGNRMLLVLYPFVPWLGIMLLGFCLGKWFEPSAAASVRPKRLAALGLALIVLFIVLRTLNGYGDPTPRQDFDTLQSDFFSFMNVQKYPPSLMFASITIGIGLLLLALFENIRNPITQILNVYGRVPFFYYILHFFLIHAVCVAVFYAQGYGAADIRTPNNIILFRPPGLGYPLWINYLIWLALLAVLYPLCKWYNRYKSTHGYWWLSYL
jgi:uncharacterized membrane protein